MIEYLIFVFIHKNNLWVYSLKVYCLINKLRENFIEAFSSSHLKNIKKINSWKIMVQGSVITRSVKVDGTDLKSKS